jgi:hypothetical protein
MGVCFYVQHITYVDDYNFRGYQTAEAKEPVLFDTQKIAESYLRARLIESIEEYISQFNKPPFSHYFEFKEKECWKLPRSSRKNLDLLQTIYNDIMKGECVPKREEFVIGCGEINKEADGDYYAEGDSDSDSDSDDDSDAQKTETIKNDDLVVTDQ